MQAFDTKKERGSEDRLRLYEEKGQGVHLSLRFSKERRKQAPDA